MNVTGFKKHHEDKGDDEPDRSPFETSHNDFKHGHQNSSAVAAALKAVSLPTSAARMLFSELPRRVIEGHDYIAVIESYMGGGRKLKCPAPGAQFLYGEVHRPLSDLEAES